MDQVINELVKSHLVGRPCIEEESVIQERVRQRLGELGVTAVNQLMRSHSAVALIEGIDDMERAYGTGMRIKSPTGYFRSLLK